MTAQIGIQDTATLSVLSVGQPVRTSIRRGLIIMSCLLLPSLHKVQTTQQQAISNRR